MVWVTTRRPPHASEGGGERARDRGLRRDLSPLPRVAARQLRGGAEVSPVMRIGEVVTHEEGDLLTVWLWWAVPGTALESAGLIKIAPTGVVSERLTYFTKLEI